MKQKECNLVIMEKASNTPRRIPDGVSTGTRIFDAIKIRKYADKVKPFRFKRADLS